MRSCTNGAPCPALPCLPALLCREINRIRGLLGTAVNVQSMVYGNLNDNSGTGAPPRLAPGWAPLAAGASLRSCSPSRP